MSDEGAPVNTGDVVRYVLRKALILLMLLTVCALAVGCRTDAPPVVHRALGSWGVRTQSGELIEAIELRADGMYLILEGAGIRALEGDGRFAVVDGSTLRALDTVGSDGTQVEFVVAGDGLTLVYGDSSASGFERMTEP